MVLLLLLVVVVVVILVGSWYVAKQSSSRFIHVAHISYQTLRVHKIFRSLTKKNYYTSSCFLFSYFTFNYFTYKEFQYLSLALAPLFYTMYLFYFLFFFFFFFFFFFLTGGAVAAFAAASLGVILPWSVFSKYSTIRFTPS